MKVTKHIGLDEELAVKLVKESKETGKTQISIIEYALKAYFEFRIMASKNTCKAKI